jgi:DNA-binding beta-propeller fold protein YncE
MAQSSAAVANRRSSVVLNRPPARVIHDPYPTFSAVAVDPKNNEIVLQDENLFQLMVYDRSTNTPPAANLSEPKRVIGGHDTKVEFNCAIYIDPKTGDLYSVNNDTLDTLTVFSRSQRGNVHPARELSTPHRTYGIAVDEGREEMSLTVQDPPMVVVYHKSAKGEDKPLRVLRGNRTGLEDPHGIGLDTRNGWMFVANYGNFAAHPDGGGNNLPGRGYGEMQPGSGRYEPPSITAYPIQASGDTRPLRVIEGPDTQLNWPAHISVDEEHGEIYVANDGTDAILVFRVTDSGNVAPTRVLKGSKTQIQNPTGVVVDTINNELVVANMGNHRATVYPRTAQGDTPPIRTIRTAANGTPALQIGNPGAVAYDTKRDEILVPN